MNLVPALFCFRECSPRAPRAFPAGTLFLTGYVAHAQPVYHVPAIPYHDPVQRGTPETLRLYLSSGRLPVGKR